MYLLGSSGMTRKPFYCLAATPFGGGWARVARLSAPFDGFCSNSSTTTVEPARDLTMDPVLRAGKVSDSDAIRWVGGWGVGGEACPVLLLLCLYGASAHCVATLWLLSYALGGSRSGYEALLVVVGTEGKGEYIKGAAAEGPYSTTARQLVKEWACADGSKAAMPGAATSSSKAGGGAPSSSCGCGPGSPVEGTDLRANAPKVRHSTPQGLQLAGWLADCLVLSCVGVGEQLQLGCKGEGIDPAWRFGLNAGGGVCGLDNRGAYDADLYLRPAA